MMFKVMLPPFRIEAFATLAFIALIIFSLIQLFDPTKPFPKTVPSALLMALFISEWVVIFFGTLFSESFRNWLYEPAPDLNQQLEKIVPALFFGGIVTTIGAGYFVYRAWELLR
jgi:threonine/homoserine/homoserine lactone efflux protein